MIRKWMVVGCVLCLTDAGCPGTPDGRTAGTAGGGDPATCESNAECSWRCVAPGDSPGCGIPPGYAPDECSADADCFDGDICVDVAASNAGCGMNAHRACMTPCAPLGNVVPSRDGEALVCDASGRYVRLVCTSDEVCPERHTCQDGSCRVRRCATSSDCDDLFCVNGLCYDAPGRCYPCCPP